MAHYGVHLLLLTEICPGSVSKYTREPDYNYYSKGNVSEKFIS